jgi:hypothetical protein
MTRTIDTIDRAHAHTAAWLHEVRNELLASLERGLERAEVVSSNVIQRARKGIKHVDVVSANAVNRAQGVVGQAIEKARLARATPPHLPS